MKGYGIVDQIGEAAALEQLAEEASELSKAALKLARIIRGENPTPVDFDTAFRSFLEELGDTRLCAKVLEDRYGPLDTLEGEKRKLKRWKHRLPAFYHGKREKATPEQEQPL